MQTQLQDVKDLFESAVIIDETAEGEKKQKDRNAIPAPTQGEHKAAKNINPPEPSLKTQGEHAYKELTLLVSDTNINEESTMVLYNPEKDLVDLATTEQDSEDDDDHDKQPLSKRFKIMHPFPNKPQPLAKFQWVINQTKRLGFPPPPELATFGLTVEEKKRKRAEFIKEMFVTKDVRVDGMNRNLIPPPRVVPIEGLVIKEPESGIFSMNRNTDVVMKGLSEYEALESNIRRIQVKDIVKEVKDYLKTYSSAGIDISWHLLLCQTYTMPITTALITTTTAATTNVAQSVVDENLPQLLDSRGGSHVTNVPAFDKEDFTSWKVRFLVFHDGLEPYLLKTLEDGPFLPMSSLSTTEYLLPKRQNQWSNAESRLANQDK
ncbi:hypothetical protein Tco_1301404 [Tanacetum coccineum]